MADITCDALVIGGGFFGCEVALALAARGLERVVVVEREADLLRRASFVNQARVHNGYHYPRSFATAARSRRHFERFADEYAEAVVRDFTKLYAIARGSRVSASQFSSFCEAIGAPCRPASQRHRHLFDLELIEECFETEEFAFDARKLAAKLRRDLQAAGIDVRLGTEARIVRQGSATVTVQAGGREETAPWVFNCTYGQLEKAGVALKARIKKEVAEMVLIEPPLPLARIGVTVMDGPYFSTMPFPAAGLHSLSHVRYTPHGESSDPDFTATPIVRSNRDYMLRDAARYMPVLEGARVVRSLVEIKAVLLHAEQDDGRPILVERGGETGRVLSILGAKLDNIYDVREYLSGSDWASAA